METRASGIFFFPNPTLNRRITPGGKPFAKFSLNWFLFLETVSTTLQFINLRSFVVSMSNLLVTLQIDLDLILINVAAALYCTFTNLKLEACNCNDIFRHHPKNRTSLNAPKWPDAPGVNTSLSRVEGLIRPNPPLWQNPAGLCNGCAAGGESIH